MDISFDYSNGHLTIRTEEFFPTTKEKIRKLNKVVKVWSRWGDRNLDSNPYVFWIKILDSLIDDYDRTKSRIPEIEKQVERTRNKLRLIKKKASKEELKLAEEAYNGCSEELRRAKKRRHRLNENINIVRMEVLPEWIRSQ